MANWQENMIERSRELSLRLREIVATVFAVRNLPDAVEVLESVLIEVWLEVVESGDETDRRGESF